MPFVFLHGMWQFGVLAGVLWTSGVLLGVHAQPVFSLGGWITGLALLVYPFVGSRTVRRETAS